MTTQPKTVFVTGASSGFGAAIVRRFAADGARVVASARRADRLAGLADELGPDILPLELDVRDRAEVEQVIGNLPAAFAEIDLLVNDAGLAKGLQPAHEADLDDWEQMVDTNCKGLVYCTRAVLPGMVRRGRGHVINMGSIAGTYPYPGGNVYGATKAFVHQFSLNLRSDLRAGAAVALAMVILAVGGRRWAFPIPAMLLAFGPSFAAGWQPGTLPDGEFDRACRALGRLLRSFEDV